MIRKLVLLIALGLVVLLMGAGEYLHLSEKKQVSFALTDAGDTALSVMFIPSTGLDSFLYHDSIRFPSDTSLYDTVSWVSPSQKMQITIALDGVVPDTSITYSCSLDLGTNITGFEYDPSGLDDTTVALLIDNLVDSLNNVTTIKDTILAQDSVTYIKIISKIAQIGLEGDARWTMKVGDSLDTVSTWVTTIANVCSAMTALVNGLDSARFWDAVDNDTSYTITGNKNNDGIHIFAVYTDTAQDTVYLADSVSSRSSDSGTVGISNVYGFRTLVGKIILDPEMSVYAGLGNDDSGIVQLYTVEGNERTILQADTFATLPGTTRVRISEAVGDTVLLNRIEVWWYVDDSCSDTVLTIQYPLVWNLRFK